MPVSDTEAFKRIQRGFSSAISIKDGGASRFHKLDTWANSLIGHKADPDSVSFDSLRKLDSDPVVYLAEWCLTSLVKRPDLFFVSHPDPSGKMVSEVEEWLWPILPDLLPVIVRAFSYGVSPYVLDWTQENLIIRGRNGRKKTLSNHMHYNAVHEIWPGDVELETQDDALLAIHYGENAYGPGRGRIAIWGRQFGQWRGQAARRRAWRYSVKKAIFELMQARYLEKSVDPPRLVFVSSDGDLITETGEAQSVGDHIAMVMGSLRNQGVATLPGNRDENGNRLYDVELLNLPDRSEVWNRALNRFDSQIIEAFLVPPAMAGIEDSLGSGGRVLDKLLSNMIEALASWVAVELSAIVSEVHSRNHPEDTITPEILAYRIPDKVQKLYLETLRSMGDGARLGDRVDARSLLDQLGIPLLPEQPERSSSPAVEQEKPGPDKDATGDREERREDAKTDEGAEDTGMPRDEPDAIPAQDATAPREERGEQDFQMFAYHLNSGIITINEARANLGLPAIASGDLTVPEYLASLRKGSPDDSILPEQIGSEEEGASGADVLHALGLGGLEA